MEEQSKRISWKPGTMVYPLPAVLVSCGDKEENHNILTISWVGTICSDPAMCYISVRPERHSYPILKQTGEFVLNLTTEKMAFATDWCGVRSGKDYNKFSEMKLTKGKAEKVNAPIVLESPINIECKVKKIIELGSHDMFVADVLCVNVAKELMDEKGRICLEKAGLIAYSHGEYFALGEKLGSFGYSVKKPVKKKRKKK